MHISTQVVYEIAGRLGLALALLAAPARLPAHPCPPRLLLLSGLAHRPAQPVTARGWPPPGSAQY